MRIGRYSWGADTPNALFLIYCAPFAPIHTQVNIAFIANSCISSDVGSLIRRHFWRSTILWDVLDEENYPFLQGQRPSALSKDVWICTYKENSCFERKRENDYFELLADTSRFLFHPTIQLSMASLIKSTAFCLLRARTLAAPVVTRSFAYRTVKIEPVGTSAFYFSCIACWQQAALGRWVETVASPCYWSKRTRHYLRRR